MDKVTYSLVVGRYTGLDLELSFKDHYHEVLDTFDGLFGYIFDHLASDYKPELAAIRAQVRQPECIHAHGPPTAVPCVARLPPAFPS